MRSMNRWTWTTLARAVGLTGRAAISTRLAEAGVTHSRAPTCTQECPAVRERHVRCGEPHGADLNPWAGTPRGAKACRSAVDSESHGKGSRAFSGTGP
jgi:hypothetical protein